MEEVNNLRHLQVKHPASIYIVGPSGSGKTVFTRSLLNFHEKTFFGIENKNVINVIWAYGIWQNLYSIPLENVNFKYIEGLPEEDDVEGFDIIVIDDLMSELKHNKFVLDLFTKGSHHNNQTAILLTQNLYHKGPIIRDLNLNSHYLIIFKSPRDKMQIMTLAKQTHPRNSLYFMSAYEQATYPPHGYLLIDFKQDTPEKLRLRTRVIPSEDTNWELKPFGFLEK